MVEFIKKYKYNIIKILITINLTFIIVQATFNVIHIVIRLNHNVENKYDDNYIWLFTTAILLVLNIILTIKMNQKNCGIIFICIIVICILIPISSHTSGGMNKAKGTWVTRDSYTNIYGIDIWKFKPRSGFDTPFNY